MSGLKSPGEYSINNAISVLSLIAIIPDVILPTLTPWLIGKRKGKKILLFMTIEVKGNYFINYQFKDGRLDSLDLNRIVIIMANTGSVDL